MTRGEDDAEKAGHAVTQHLPAQDWHTVLVFDGRGGVRRLSDQEESAFVVPPRGFALVSGRLGSP